MRRRDKPRILRRRGIRLSVEDINLRRQRLRRAAKRHPSAFLLAAQLLSLLVYPLMDNSVGGRLLFGAVALVVVPLAVWVVNRSSFVNTVAWLLAIPAMLLTVVGVVFEHDALLPLSAMLEAALYFYAAASLISYMLHDHKVTPTNCSRRQPRSRCWPGASPTSISFARRGTPAASPASSPSDSAPGWSCCSTASPTCPRSAWRRAAGQRTGARADHARAVRRGRLHRHRGVAADRPDHRAPANAAEAGPPARYNGGLADASPGLVGMKLPLPFIQLPLRYDADALAAEIEAFGEGVWRDASAGIPGQFDAALARGRWRPGQRMLSPGPWRQPRTPAALPVPDAGAGQLRRHRGTHAADAAGGPGGSDAARRPGLLLGRTRARARADRDPADGALRMRRRGDQHGRGRVLDLRYLAPAPRVQRRQPQPRIHLVADTVGGERFLGTGRRVAAAMASRWPAGSATLRADATGAPAELRLRSAATSRRR